MTTYCSIEERPLTENQHAMLQKVRRWPGRLRWEYTEYNGKPGLTGPQHWVLDSLIDRKALVERDSRLWLNLEGN